MSGNHLFLSLHDGFIEGGWPMYPVLIFGLLLLTAAWRYMRQPEERHLPLLRSLGSATLASGFLGTVLGVIHTLEAIHQVPLELTLRIALLGLGESLNNLALALLLFVLASVIRSVGTLRAEDRRAQSSGQE